MTDTVLVDVRDQVANVTVNRPEKYNALDLALLDGLLAAAGRVAGDSSIMEADWRFLDDIGVRLRWELADVGPPRDVAI
jgi:hypothetical protein